jgi:hypothetical protein
MSRVYLGAGWELRHVTDRTAYLVKESHIYRDLTDRDGYVLARIEPGGTRKQLLEDAMNIAAENDARLGLMLGEKLLPSSFKAQERAKKYNPDDIVVSAGGSKVVSLEQHRFIQAMLARPFGTPEDPQVKLYRP